MIVYLDDIVVHGTCPIRVWEETKLCLERLCRAGFMINLRKSSLLVSTMRMLGHMVTRNTIRPVYTQLDALVKAERTPRTVGDVRRLYGLLSYFCQYVDGFA